jgi:hypothetical protein
MLMLKLDTADNSDNSSNMISTIARTGLDAFTPKPFLAIIAANYAGFAGNTWLTTVRRRGAQSAVPSPLVLQCNWGILDFHLPSGATISVTSVDFP